MTDEVADLKVIILEIDAALCNYCNTVDETWHDHVPSSWDEASRARFRELCVAYNLWHERSDVPGAISAAFYKQHGKKLHDAENEIERLRHLGAQRKSKQGKVAASRNRMAEGVEHWKAEAERLRAALKPLVETHDYRSLDLGIGTALPDGKMWLEARAVINQQQAPEKT